MSTLLIVTGASRGLGRSFAVAFARHTIQQQQQQQQQSTSKIPTVVTTSPPSQNNPSSSSSSPTIIRIVLLARSEDDLIETKHLVQNETSKQQQQQQEQQQNQQTDDATSIDNKNNKTPPPQPPIIDISHHVIDLSNLHHLENQINTLFSHLSPSPSFYHHAILVNNAGSVGPLGPASSSSSLSSLHDFRQCVDLNITSSLWISCRFAHYFSSRRRKSSDDDDDDDDDIVGEGGDAGDGDGSSCVIVNVSSLCAVEPFETMSLYCSGKAARDMFHKTMSLESPSSYKTLNYAPGACDTDMQRTLRTSDETSTKYRDLFKKMKEEGTLVAPDDTADRLATLVYSEDFESGSHVDYWDLVNAGGGGGEDETS